MKLGIFTIVLDGMPFIQHHLKTFEQLPFDWHWSIAEGSAQNKADTFWCRPQERRHSLDGTVEYLDSIEGDKVSMVSDKDWENKTVMCNSALLSLEDCNVLLQVDVDEFHSVDNIKKIVHQFTSQPDLGAIRLPCRYFVGPDLVCQGDNCWSNRGTEWCRAWRFKPTYQFKTHEPPALWPRDTVGRIITRQTAKEIGLIFDHFAYATLKQVAYKEKFYGYVGLVNQWKALQDHTGFPERLNKFFPFVDGNVTVKRLDPSQIPPILKACS